MHSDHVKAHFEEEAKIFDVLILNVVPNYKEMISALISAIPFPKDKRFSVADLGCGTGTISKAVTDAFPNVSVTCIDIAENMLDIAKTKVGKGAKYVLADLNDYEFEERYDLIVSSLALHHLESDGDKMRLYRKIHSALNPNGMFVNADIVLGENERLQSVNMEKWHEFLKRSFPEDEIQKKWLPTYYAEDRPARLLSHLDMLRECGFSVVDVIYKYYGYAVYCAEK